MQVETSIIKGSRIIVLSSNGMMIPLFLSTFRKLSGWEIYKMMKQLEGKKNEIQNQEGC